MLLTSLTLAAGHKPASRFPWQPVVEAGSAGCFPKPCPAPGVGTDGRVGGGALQLRWASPEPAWRQKVQGESRLPFAHQISNCFASNINASFSKRKSVLPTDYLVPPKQLSVPLRLRRVYCGLRAEPGHSFNHLLWPGHCDHHHPDRGDPISSCISRERIWVESENHTMLCGRRESRREQTLW